jgi:hypothetical protein
LTYPSALKMEASGSSKTLVILYQATWHHISEGSDIIVAAMWTSNHACDMTDFQYLLLHILGTEVSLVQAITFLWNCQCIIGCDILATVAVMSTVCWDVTPCSLVHGAHCNWKYVWCYRNSVTLPVAACAWNELKTFVTFL